MGLSHSFGDVLLDSIVDRFDQEAGSQNLDYRISKTVADLKYQFGEKTEAAETFKAMAIKDPIDLGSLKKPQLIVVLDPDYYIGEKSMYALQEKSKVDLTSELNSLFLGLPEKLRPRIFKVNFSDFGGKPVSDYPYLYSAEDKKPNVTAKFILDTYRNSL